MCLIDFWNFLTIHVFGVKESIADISTELPCLGDLGKPGRLPVQHVLGGTGECVLSIFEMSSLFMFLRSGNPLLTFLLSYHVRATSKIQVTFPFKRFLKLPKHSFCGKNALNLYAIALKDAWWSHDQCFIVNFIVMPRHVTSCHVMSRHVTSCHVISHHVTSCDVMPRHVTSCHVMSRHATSCDVISRPVTSCRVMSRHVTSCHVISHMTRHATSCHVTSCHHIMSRHVTWCHVMSRHAMSFHVTSRHVTSCHIMPLHDKSHHVTSCHSCHVMPRHATSCHAISHHVLSSHVTSCHVMSRPVTSCHVMSRHVTSWRVLPYHVLPRHVPPGHILSHLVTSCYIVLRHATSLHVTSCQVMSCPVTSCHVGCPEGRRFHTASAVYHLVFFYSPFVLRNYSTVSHKILRDCVFWCSLNNPIVLKFFWRHLAEKIAKNSENFVKISWVDSDFWQ